MAQKKKHLTDSDTYATSTSRLGDDGVHSPRTTSLLIYFRYLFVASIILVIAGWIIYNLAGTTVVHAEEWTEKANKELSKEVVVMPVRGDILADDGTVMATNLTYYTVRMDFRASGFRRIEFEAALDSLCDSLAKYHPTPQRPDAAAWKSAFLSELQKKVDDRSRSFTLARDISFADEQRLRTFPFFHRWPRNGNKTGLTSETRILRSYPYGEMARRSVGRVGQTAECAEVHGISGLEKALDTLLFGIPGKAKKVPLTHDITNWTDIPPRNGYTLKTTIDIRMQDIAEHELNAMLETTGAEWGTVVLMHVPTGDIKAISNLERDPATGQYIEAMNRALQGFEPGSVMKTISMVVALEDGFCTNINQVYPIGHSYAYAGGSPIRDTHSPAALPVSRFLEYSSNIGMTKLMTPHYQTDPNGFRERLRRMGFLDRFNTGIAGETVPYFPYLDLKAGGLVSLSRQVYGYTSRIPPLYMCAFYNAVANDGKFVRPRIVQSLHDEHGLDSILPVSYVRDRICSPEHARQVRTMLHDVIYGQAGTARMLRSDVVDIAGKTGTSRIAREIEPAELERCRELLKIAKTREDSLAAIPKAPRGYYEGRYRLAFCGFFPYDKPEYTCMVLISNPSPQYRGAGYTSGMVLYNIAHKMHARGLIGKEPDYALDDKGARVTPQGRNPKVCAGVTGKEQLNNILGTAHIAGGKATYATAPGRVPDVRGMSLRQALRELEGRGYSVQVRGQGFVRQQLPEAGARPNADRRVILSLAMDTDAPAPAPTANSEKTDNNTI